MALSKTQKEKIKFVRELVANLQASQDALFKQLVKDLGWTDLIYFEKEESKKLDYLFDAVYNSKTNEELDKNINLFEDNKN
jgi:hypothetical protein